MTFSDLESYFTGNFCRCNI